MNKTYEQKTPILVSASFVLVVLACSPLSIQAGAGRVVKNHFNEGREGWRIYDYNGGKPGGGNVFFPAVWEKTGGVENSGYIWADDSKWRIDTPEKPDSILPFIIYRQWVDGKALDIRQAKVSLYLRGDKLDLKGAKCLFWAFNRTRGTRYHYTGAALKVSEGEWGQRQTIVLKNDKKLWNESWSRHPDKPASLDEVLRECDSYGISFVGFSAEVTGWLAMDQLVIEPAKSELTQKENTSKPYRVIFNCDGHAVAKDAQGDLNQWIENLFGPLEKSHVDALFWCDGAGGNTANYDSKVLERTGHRAGKPRTYIDKWIDEGNDPPKVVVREAKRCGLDVFYSFRINDIHDSFIPDEMPMFKVKNPDWMIGERKYGKVTSFKTALNFAVPDVRELKFRVIEELFQNYDFDGLEIDFLRSAPYFLPGTESKNAHLLTDLLRRVRRHLTERGKQRGRPIRLAVRVNESLRSCELDGFDVPKWIDQELVDIITLGSGVMDIEIGEFKKLAAPKGIHVYPCLYGWPSKYSPIPAELATGLALNYWAQGADGIYLFNWFPHTKNNSESTGAYMAPLLKQLGNPNTLRSKQRIKMFAADRGRPQRAYQYNWLHCVLPAPVSSDESLKVKMRVFEQFSDNDKLSFEMQIENLQSDDLVSVTLNGKPVNGLKRSNANRLAAPIKSGHLRPGVNEVSMRLTKRSVKSSRLRLVTAVELHVRQ